MLIVGERINTSRKGVAALVCLRDGEAVVREAVQQREAGADFIDVNAGTLLAEEPEALRWLVTTIQAAVAVPLCVDSPNPAAMAAALEVHQGKALLNSITGERERFRATLPLVKRYGCGVVALCLDDSGMPSSAEEAVQKGSRLVEDLLEAGVPAEDIYVDPLVRPVSTDSRAGVAVVEAIRILREKYPGVHTICGLSNVSFGLPQRRLLNQAFLVATMTAGLDAVILDPLDTRLMALLRAAEAVLGRDEYCARYLRAYREGRLAEG
ncbi:MAG: methyltetrahydrofolate cobalamin methyltransferase [Bacillota bacterium]|nr:methyltetrahydrofolate cobalamin methyltransferase [Bacillota bacterium]